MPAMVRSFQELTPELQKLAGGKGGTLSRLFQAGYPVPNGFVIFPSAFHGDTLHEQAWDEILAHIAALRGQRAGVQFAVRSSALSEDSRQASFAGEFETVLHVETDEAIQEAIYTVFRSRESDRVKAYSAAKGMDTAHAIAVVVQLMVPSELSGVLFTADPITGSRTHMIGNYVSGIGERLVAGEADAESFRLARPKGQYHGPHPLRKYARQLYQLGTRLEQELDGPQDIEWAVAEDKLYLLQARPITTLSVGDLQTYDINESLAGDELWINTNIGEAVPDVLTPLTWSVIRRIDHEFGPVPGYYIWSGNIAGRAYSNISRRASVVATLLGIDIERVMRRFGDMFGQIPEGMEIPVYPSTRLDVIRVMVPRLVPIMWKILRGTKQLSHYLAVTPAWCQEMATQIGKAETKAELLSLWEKELWPYITKAWWAHSAGSSKLVRTMRFEQKLAKWVGLEDTNALLSNLRESSGLASLGPLIGVSRVAKGEMTRAEYLMRYGHRGPHEFELSIPHPAEDAGWLDQRIAEFIESELDVEELLANQRRQHEEAKARFVARFPKKAQWLEKQLANVSEGAYLREAARSEFVRVFRLVRVFALRVGEMTGIGKDIFFLYQDEVADLLSGDERALVWIPARKANYEKYRSFPPFPPIIRGRFDPVAWVNDPNRRNDYYDPAMAVNMTGSQADILKGRAGAAGRVEGYVRILHSPEEGEALQVGEILVATSTNVGWTPLFPKAAAIITDIGAPLSHAAIVARELGLPAVVGCGNATSRLKTGDKVLVDGGQGVVYLLERATA